MMPVPPVKTYVVPPLKITVSPGNRLLLAALAVAAGSPGQCFQAELVDVPLLVSNPAE